MYILVNTQCYICMVLRQRSFKISDIPYNETFSYKILLLAALILSVLACPVFCLLLAGNARNVIDFDTVHVCLDLLMTLFIFS